ncbi:MAG: hypothetical protein MZV70_19055 [Desulfobacterales bacterium]|nr:hypothetical protein [Desulfobacterales bacterium]
MQFNIVDRELLLEAMDRPERAPQPADPGGRATRTTSRC